MNKFYTIAAMFALTLQGYAGEPKKGIETNIENDDTTKLKFPGMRIIIIEEESDDDDNSNMIVNDDTIDVDFEEHHSPESFCHWQGIDVGINGYVSPNQSLGLQSEADFAELDYGSSFVVNLNMFQKTFPLVQNYVSLSTGLGFSFNRYGMKKNINLVHNSDSIWGIQDTTRTFKKNFLKATYLEIPLLLTINTGKDPDRSVHITAGVIGGYKIGSKYKRKWEVDGDLSTDKTKASYNINPFRLYATARVGYGKFTAFANYGLTSFFESGRGPELYPFSAGISVIPF